jgi:hypothetical protein
MRKQRIDGTPIESDNEIKPTAGIHGSGTITMYHPMVAKDKAMCRGCRNDFYNETVPTGCWSFAKALVVDKVGHSTLNVVGGPDAKMTRTLSCWHGVRK